MPTPDEEIIALLKRLGTLKVEYPAELFAARRAAFAVQIEQHNAKRTKTEEYFSEERVIELLESLKPVRAEYPPELLANRRAAFLAQIAQRSNGHVPQESPAQDQLIQLLGRVKSAPNDYPPELLSARRAAFLEQIRQHNQEPVPEEAPSQDRVLELLEQVKSAPAQYPPELLSAQRAAFLEQIRQHNRVIAPLDSLPARTGSTLRLLSRLKAIEIRYPLKLWSARRSHFVAQIRDGKMSVLDALHSTFRTIFQGKRQHPGGPAFSFGRTSLILVALLLAAFIGSRALGNPQPLTQILQPGLTDAEGPVPSPLAAATSTSEVAKVICKPGYLPPLCLAQEFDQSQDLTFPGNGSARPAVAKDTFPGYSRIHKAANANDGLYGPGASWVSNSAFSWIKIDLGEIKTINTVTFGRDRLGNLNDGDPGQFIIAVAIYDDMYANGNSHNDSMEYQQVYDSEEVGFDGVITGPETIEAKFESVQAKYVKITFENAGTAVDEIEAFMILPSGYASGPTQRPRDTLVPPSFTPIPTNTLIASRTPTRVPTNTLVPTWTSTPIPTNTDVPADTITPRPTNTDVPTDTPEPPPTDTPEPPPTDTPEPPPTDTPEPPPPDTPEPSTSTSEPMSLSTGTPEGTLP